MTVADAVAVRYHQPASPTSLDPAVTADGDGLGMESSSGCCGDFPLRRALTGLGSADWVRCG
ncbi:hypothetical protein ACFVW1_27610 [Streptomyces olivochromogenes]|uniref:hypothetical protein n=1 Tax=Streptomyces olivochromogenes TaxID=1963 RepID=UPI0036DC7F67